MRDAAHKTSASEFAEWRDNARRVGLPARRGRVPGAPVDFEPDTEIPFGADRVSSNLPSVSATNREQLERMLDAEGLPKILRTLRELCDDRSPHEGAAFESFEPDREGEAAQVHADELESLLLRLARRVEG